MILKDKKSGKDLFECQLPDDFKVEAFAGVETYPDNQKIHAEVKAEKQGCLIVYQTGNDYVYQKKRVQMPMGMYVQQEASGQNKSGSWYSVPVSLKEELDRVAEQISKQKSDGLAYYSFSDNLAQRLKVDFDKMVSDFVRNMQIIASFQSVPVGVDIRNYLFDGGMGLYERSGKVVAVCLARMGLECDTVQRQGIMENITGEPFGQASDSPYIAASNCDWSVPFVAYMVSDHKEDLEVFMNFVDTIVPTESFRNESEMFRQQVTQYQLQKAQAEAMQNQAMWNTMFANQQQQFAAMDRLTQSIHQDLDQFHNNLNQQMAQNDMRIYQQTSGNETLDDRIQRMRHESIMGVETYERSDGSTVEYSNYADRVFENNLDNTTHFGTHHYFDDYIPEGWHELKKK